MQQSFKKLSIILCAGIVAISSMFSTCIHAYAEEVDYYEEAEARKSWTIQSNEIENWPQGPSIGAASAILIEANTGTVLYAKNADTTYYPASTTKILTTLVAIENAELNEDVSFSYEAVFSIESGSSNMGMDVGEVITMEQCLYGILVYSANEVCNAVAEHIAGSIDDFVEMMNAKAAELGCTNSHFVTTNGLHDDDHYTTARDLATIAVAFFNNETLAKISGTNYYYIPATDTQPDEIELYTHNKLTAGTYSYDGYIGGKTGYTSTSRQTLVSCAERDGMKLICVIMCEESPYQFTDTMELFDYGFDNFSLVNVAENETSYTIDTADLYSTTSDIFFSSDPIIEISTDDYVILPNGVSFSDLTSTLVYETESGDATASTADSGATTDATDSSDTVGGTSADADGITNSAATSTTGTTLTSTLATIQYTYNGTYVGSAALTLTGEVVMASDDTTEETEPSSSTTSTLGGAVTSDTVGGKSVVFINVLRVLGIIILVLVILLVGIFAFAFLRNYHFGGRRASRHRARRRRRRKKKSHRDFDSY